MENSIKQYQPIGTSSEPSIDSGLKDAAWYLLASKPKQEIRAVENLANQGIKAYCPMIKVERMRAGKKYIVDEALFSGYLFVYLSPQSPIWHKVRSTRGVRDWVRFAHNVAQLPTALVEEILNQQNTMEEESVMRFYKPGESVRILSGPFQGLTGIYQASSGEERAIILIDFLGNTSQMIVDNQSIQKE
ncbi:MAG: transcription/translation regulatory transformer protein RfaH [Gammaproteobacteria bacterium]|nr:transcription/translation regulatory transformer protein RfaH [Gammaproteobacteria bacterium]MDH5630981.1 transcription/translation regulatory transformer protein RfaH [Gammaproteobacteria bacterium]